MNAWMRPLLGPGKWHLLVMITRSGLRVAHCGVSYPPNDELQGQALEIMPEQEACETCYAVYLRSRVSKPGSVNASGGSP